MTKTILFLGNSVTSIDQFRILIDQMKECFDLSIKCVLFDVQKREFVYREDVVTEPPSADSNSLRPDAGVRKTTLRHIGRAVKRLLKRTCIGFFVEYRDWCFLYRNSEKLAKNLLDTIRPDLVISNSDRTNPIPLFVFKESKDIFHVVMPAGLLGTVESTASNAFKQRSHSVNHIYDLKRFVASKYPNQAIRIGGKTALFFEASQIVALRKFGILTEFPWIEGGYAETDMVCVANEQDKNLICKYTEKKVLITGLIEDYVVSQSLPLRDEIRKRIKKRYEICSEEICILGVPNYAELNLCSMNTHTHNMELLIDLLAKRFGTIALSFHPLSNLENYKSLKRKQGVVFLQERLRDVIVAADYYFSEDTSSTSRWAKISGCKWIPLLTEKWKFELSKADIEKYLMCIDLKDNLDCIMHKSMYSDPIDMNKLVDIKTVLVECLNTDSKGHAYE